MPEAPANGGDEKEVSEPRPELTEAPAQIAPPEATVVAENATDSKVPGSPNEFLPAGEDRPD